MSKSKTMPNQSCDNDNKIALYLAYRGYAYSLMHLVFGSAPTQEVLSKVYSGKTFDMLHFFIELTGNDVICDSAAKDGVCKSDESSESGVIKDDVAKVGRNCDALKRLEIFLNKEISVDNESHLITLAAEYTKLFLVPGSEYVYPWESVYIAASKMMFRESTLEVRDYYHAAGLKLQSEKHFPDDHIAAMMDYMGHMSVCAYNAFVEGQDSKVVECLTTQKLFAEKHIANWDKAFAEDIGAKAQNSLYAVFSCAMAAIVDLDLKYLPKVIEELSCD